MAFDFQQFIASNTKSSYTLHQKNMLPSQYQEGKVFIAGQWKYHYCKHTVMQLGFSGNVLSGNKSAKLHICSYSKKASMN